MNAALLKGLVALVPACMLFSGSVVLFFRGKTVCSLLQLLGAGCLVLVVLTHICEALHLFPWMHWGARAGRWSLSRFLERCSWSHIVSRGIFVSCAYKATGLIVMLKITPSSLFQAGQMTQSQAGENAV